LDAENDNLRAALEWSREQHDAEAGLRLLGALEQLWSWRGFGGEGLEHLAKLLALPEARVVPGEGGSSKLNASKQIMRQP
jgi:predicted ATPase